MNKPLRIGLIMLGGRSWIGGSEYIKNIILALSSLPTEMKSTFEICLLYSGETIDSDTLHQLAPYLKIAYNLDDELQPRTLFNRVKWKIRRILFSEIHPRMSVFLRKININFVYPYLLSDREQTLNFQGNAWFPDFQYKYLPHLYSEAEIRDWDKYVEQISELNQTVILSSKNAANDLQKFFPNSKFKVQILNFRTHFQSAWHKKDPLLVQKKYHLPDRYFLVSNQFWQHKNHLIIFEALKILKSKSICPVVVFTGSIYDYRKPEYIDSILETIHTYDLAFQTYILGLIPKSDQMQLMRRSIAVIQPSLFEGWSTVIEDARCLGKKMILSDFPVHLEQNPPNSIFYERHSSEQLADLIYKSWNIFSTSPDFYQEALAKAKNIQEVQEFALQFLAIAKGENNIVK
ncbi:glycosyltransferase [Synechococcus sp. PCC 7502]|uniref:glycosyltransferase n=1 Tax=Synechococcus sp. PCC 7502 TaxID=1173263 RepID=UPI00029FBBA2|nr:glycosyltransferase [Synechococcus sp. PCC 7502]AFY75126.1 glycosyltransferase [Synechococcus sp. PCC 7502]